MFHSLSLSLSCASGMSAQLLRPEPTWMGLLRFTRCLSSRNVRPISPFMASKTPNERIVPFPVAILSWYCNYIYNSHAWTPKALPTSRCGSTLLAARIDHCSWATRFLSRALCLAMSHAASKLLMRAARIIQLQQGALSSNILRLEPAGLIDSEWALQHRAEWHELQYSLACHVVLVRTVRGNATLFIDGTPELVV